MQAMVLAAGRGTRLRPLTRHLPKPLFPLLNTPSIQRILSRLASTGFKRIIVNAYHLADQLLAWLSSLQLSADIIPVKEPELLGTGGALLNARSHMDPAQPILLMNADVATDLDPGALWNLHRPGKSVATLFVHKRSPWNKLLVRNGLLMGLDHTGPDALAFTGISVLEHKFLDYLPGSYPSSLVDGLKRAMDAREKIRTVRLEGAFRDYLWEDIGTVRGYLNAHEELLKRQGQDVSDWVCIGRNVQIGPGAVLGRTVVWDDSQVAPGEDVRETIVTPFGILRLREAPGT